MSTYRFYCTNYLTHLLLIKLYCSVTSPWRHTYCPVLVVTRAGNFNSYVSTHAPKIDSYCGHSLNARNCHEYELSTVQTRYLTKRGLNSSLTPSLITTADVWAIMPTHNYTINHRTSSHPPITQPQPHICYEGQCRNYVTYAKLQDSQQNFYLQCCSPLKSMSNLSLSVHLQFTMRPHCIITISNR